MTRVLFIDDDALTLQIMARVSTMLGYQALVSTSGQHGLLLAAQERPSIIIVDMQMDVMSGVEFVRQVRCSTELAGLPVLLCSAGMSHDDEAVALAAGADGFLKKPIGIKDLQAAVLRYADNGR